MRELARVSHRLHLAALGVVGFVSLAATAGAAIPETDPRWLPWIGCWSPSGATEDAAPAVSGVQRVCIMPVDGAGGVEIVSVTNGEIISRVRMDVTGERQPVNREGCTGWESARWSADAERLYLRSELTCSGSITRHSSGIMAVVSPSDWVDVQVVGVGDQRSTRILRYRSAADSTALSREIAGAVRDRELARQTARLAAASTPTIPDIVEASREVESAVVEAWLLQRMPRLTVNGATLRRLADARVSPSVIDLVVALGAPERYADRLSTRGYTFMRIDPPRPTTVAVAQPRPEAEVLEAQHGSVGATIEGREFYGDRHRHYEGCGHYDVLYLGSATYASYGYGYLPYWLRDPYGYGAYGYGIYGGYGYYPYDIHDPYRPPAPMTPAPRGAARVNLPDRRPGRPAPQPNPDPATQPANGRVINGGGYTKPAPPATSRGSAPAPVPARSAEPKPPEETRSATKPAPAAGARAAKRRPPPAA